jgi:hypothetical protein
MLADVYEVDRLAGQMLDAARPPTPAFMAEGASPRHLRCRQAWHEVFNALQSKLVRSRSILALVLNSGFISARYRGSSSRPIIYAAIVMSLYAVSAYRQSSQRGGRIMTPHPGQIFVGGASPFGEPNTANRFNNSANLCNILEPEAYA